MAGRQLQPMAAAEIFTWQLRQDRLYELVGGLPVLPPKMKAGAWVNHDRVVVNAIATLFTKLRGKPCRPMTADVAVSILRGNFRRPDLTIECGSL